MNFPTLPSIKSSFVESTIPRSILTSASKGSGDKRIVPMKFRAFGFVLNLLSRVNNEWAAEKLSRLWFRVFKKQPGHWVKQFWNQADQQIEINLSDKTIPVYLWGKGPLIVMMHGWSGSGTQFKRFIPLLTGAGYRVAVFDAPAHGTNPGNHTDLLEFSDSLVAIQQQIAPVDCVIAHSFGAMAVTLATQRGLMLNRLVLLAPHLDANEMFDSYAELLNLRKPLMTRFKDLAAIKMEQILQVASPWELLTTQALLTDQDLPGMIVFDEVDEEVPSSHLEQIASHWRAATTLRTTGLGHVRILKDNAVIQRVVEFLN